MNASVPCILFEDEHLLAANKPAGLNTHAPTLYAGEGLYDWLRHREPRWAKLAIMHRLDKETSGVIVFAKTTLANRSLTRQFTERAVRKKYIFLTDRAIKANSTVAVSALVRAGERYVSRPAGSREDRAETRFRVLTTSGGRTTVEAEPVTGRTHQIRVHAADQGFPILGDTQYGGTPAARVFLHSEELVLAHPETGAKLALRAPADFLADPRLALRSALINPSETNAHRIIHGAADGWPGWFVDRFGGYLLSQSGQPLSDSQRRLLDEWSRHLAVRGTYHKTLLRQVRKHTLEESGPQFIGGEPAPEAFVICENGVQFEIRFGEGYSVGLFLDQRDNRRRLLTRHIAAGFPLGNKPAQRPAVLNAFAYTCGFSVCAAKSGARVTSLDLSKRYLEWGRRHFLLNDLRPDDHEFIFGDVFDWCQRLKKKQREFDVIILDPPTFSQSREFGPFQAEKHFGLLVASCLPLLSKPGVLLASTNAGAWAAESFLSAVKSSIPKLKRRVVREHFVPQPADFPVSRAEPAHLKTIWLEIE